MRATFLRVIEADDKSSALREAIASQDGSFRFEVEPEAFQVVPRSPFAYWVGERLRRLFVDHQGRVEARRGPSTCDDFRYVRLFWEPRGIQHGTGEWVPFAKGGAYSPYFADVYLLVDWEARRQTFLGFFGRPGRWIERPESLDCFFRPGLTWPRRTNGLSFRAMPKGCIFADKGPAVFVPGDDPELLLAICAVVNSRPFQALVALQLARTELAQSYEVGLIQQTPVPDLPARSQRELTALARRAWSIKRNLDNRVETSHAFVLPALLHVPSVSLVERAKAWTARLKSAQEDLGGIRAAIDELCFDLYGIEGEDRRKIEIGFDTPTDDLDSEADDEDPEPHEVDAGPLVEALLSWSVGVAFGRFDVRLATCDHKPPPEPDPFDPLPSCSPGMLTGDDGLPIEVPHSGYRIDFPSDGILADDAGHDRDLSSRMRQVFELVFGEETDTVWREAAEILDPRKRDMRRWVGRSFFEGHIKRYSKSRRKAPIYWQLSTPSASYSVWLYLHRFTRDTFYKVLNDLVEPKLRHEERKLASLTQEAGGTPASSQRKEIDAQAGFVEGLRSFRDEVGRIAPLWDPDLDDGVMINFAPLWRLVPHHRSWQKECKKVWDDLCKGEHDWARLAMHLWPERVVPKCHKDRSLAIAHGLEEVFWEEDSDGKWKSRKVDSATIDGLIEERTSAAVRDALQSLLEAPAPTRAGSKSRGRRAGKGRRPRQRSKGGAA